MRTLARHVSQNRLRQPGTLQGNVGALCRLGDGFRGFGVVAAAAAADAFATPQGLPLSRYQTDGQLVSTLRTIGNGGYVDRN